MRILRRDGSVQIRFTLLMPAVLCTLPLLFAACASGGPPAGTVAPRTIYRIEPEYSAQLRQQNVRGVVEVSGTIPREGGRLRDLRVVRSDDPRLTQVVLDAVSRWEWKPALLEGEPIDSEFNGRFEFPPR